MPMWQGCERPLISVLMGVYYRRSNTRLLQRSIQSILSQTYSEFELLVCCDDRSTSDSQKLLDSFTQRDSRVRSISWDGHTSLSEKLNEGLRSSKGHLIARMDDDDFSHPDRFKKQLEYLAQHPEISFIGSNVRLWRDDEILGACRLPERPEVRDFLFVQPFIHPALMFRREALLAVGGYSEDRSCQKCEDYDLLLRLYEHGYHGANLQECLLDYTVPATAKGSRTMGDRWNETVTRYKRFQSLGLLPGAWPYVVKPLAVGMLPGNILSYLKGRKQENG